MGLSRNILFAAVETGPNGGFSVLFGRTTTTRPAFFSTLDTFSMAAALGSASLTSFCDVKGDSLLKWPAAAQTAFCHVFV